MYKLGRQRLRASKRAEHGDGIGGFAGFAGSDNEVAQSIKSFSSQHAVQRYCRTRRLCKS
jgi:hypothetical protein